MVGGFSSPSSILCAWGLPERPGDVLSSSSEEDSSSSSSSASSSSSIMSGLGHTPLPSGLAPPGHSPEAAAAKMELEVRREP